MKINGTYYSVYLGNEIPFEECPEGIELALWPSGTVGTKIGFDEASKAYYIIIEDRTRAALSEETSESIRKLGFKLGEKTTITRIEKPSGLLDAAAQPPSTNDDFLGWYQAVWLPIRYEIRKDGERYLCEQQLCRPGLCVTVGEPIELAPIPDRLGFIMMSSRGKETDASITYNEALKRFELMYGGSVIRSPLARISPEDDTAPVYIMEIGIPSWH